MRRLAEDERHEQSSLLRLTPPQRLFTQRWIELFDQEAICGLRCRPVWHEKIKAEINSHHQPDFHAKLMKEELSVSAPAQISDINFAKLESRPVGLAEDLASAVSTLGFDHGFLFHGFKAMLYPPGVSFASRLEKLREWWTANAVPRRIQVVFRMKKGGKLPPPGSLLQVSKWNSLPPQIRQSAQECLDWWATHKEIAEQNGAFLIVSTRACDPNNAVAIALEAHSRYCIFDTATGGGAIPIDDAWAFVDDPHQSPKGRTYALRVDKYRFRLRRAFDENSIDDFNDAVSMDEGFAKLWQYYSKAVTDIKDGNQNDALDDIAKALDIAYSGYTPIGAESSWGRARVFVEKSAIMMALDWSRTHYRYLLEYLLKPSYAVRGERLFGSELNPSKLFLRVSNDRFWANDIANSDWDELLKHRRNEVIHELSSLSAMLLMRRRQLRWDLARAVRARNSLFHRGEPLQDQYLLAVFLDAFDLVLRVRLAATRAHVGFSDVVTMAEQDFTDLLSHPLDTDAKFLFASYGWHGLRLKDT
jgi:hypothetical protein